MEPIRFHFHTNDLFFSRLIKWRTNSKVVHVSIEVRGYYYNAYLQKRFYKSTQPEGDIVETQFFTVDSKTADEIVSLLDSGLGTLYDYRAIFGFVTGRFKQSRGRWFCSEIANMVLDKIIPSGSKATKLLSPEDLRLAIVYYKKGLAAASLINKS